jgi:hypothetical protein
MNNPKEKAIELTDKMFMQSTSRYDAKQCALIAVDLHLDELSKMKLIFSDRELHYKFWQDIKTEIQNL